MLSLDPIMLIIKINNNQTTQNGIHRTQTQVLSHNQSTLNHLS